MSLPQGLLPHFGETCVSEPRIPRPTEILYAVRHTAVSVTPLRRPMVETRSL
jgi:hypothetical protein